MVKLSSGLLLHREVGDEVQVLLVHPGGPFWAKKDDGAWSIPKGEHGPDDDPHATAIREFTEELGSPPPPASPDPTVADDDLGFVRLASGKRIRCFARAADFDATAISSNTFEQEWPPRSGQIQAFPEVDRAEWFPLPIARVKLNPAQAELIDRLEDQRAAAR
ncbi:NUDIX domain-containing protein [Aquihabitans sp. McL0605]|uniref:NUDIX domain-containing protein n=1 Tax=Aquihabitans sp. McL0605 TaxID=3415671 RepID=UPI003CF5432E